MQEQAERRKTEGAALFDFANNIDRYGIRKVYWIVPFGERVFEDSLVQIYKQYVETENIVEVIDNTLQISYDARKDLPKDKFVLLTMEVEYDNILIKTANFEVLSFGMKGYLNSHGYIYIGMVNTTKEEVEIYTQAKKYNL